MIHWGIIGVGDVCEVKSGPAFNKVDGSKLVAVMRRTAHLAEDYAKRHAVPKWYDNAEKLIKDPEVNAIYIATPPDTHLFYTKMAAKEGKPIYVEKPMARSHAECLKMVEVCENYKVPLFVAYYRRALPNFLKVKELVDSGAIGEIRMVEITLLKSYKADIAGEETGWRTNPAISGGGYFHDLASHQLDFLDFLLGPIESAKGFAVNFGRHYPADDTVLATFRFQSGVLGTGSWCFVTDSATEKEVTTIYGSAGRIEFSFFGSSEVRLFSKEKEEFSFNMPKHIQQPFIDTVVKELLGSPNACSSTGISGARTSWVLDKITAR